MKLAANVTPHTHTHTHACTDSMAVCEYKLYFAKIIVTEKNITIAHHSHGQQLSRL